MRGGSGNPADDGRDTHSHVDQSTKDAERTPSLVVFGAAALAFVVCPVAFAFGQVGVGIAAAIAGLLVSGFGLDWLAMERRRVRQAEREWRINHPAG